MMPPIATAFAWLAVLGGAGASSASAARLGVFSAQGDVGAPVHPGAAAFDARTGSYAVTAGGANMMHDHDEFHFVWREVTGDFTLRARIAFTGPGVEPHRKAGLMARGNLAPGAAYVDAAIHGQGPLTLQTRRADGGDTEMQMTEAAADAAGPELATPEADFVQLERHGAQFVVSIKQFGKPITRRSIDASELGKTLYLGLFLCAHDKDAVETARFDGVALDHPRP